MLFVELIRKKRDGKELSRQEIEAAVSGYTCGELPDYQMSAFLMAALIRGLSRAETAALTSAMLHSGKVLDFSALAGSKVDKHSTGGVGDKTSLIVAPIAAAGGLRVPMISGRGLGHTGGTLDKLEAIPGFNVRLPLDEFGRILAKIGCAMIGQTDDLAPADKKLYALRDVTGTVESPSLICASIMSKKLAEGIDGLVLDVKTGSGAFMKRLEDSELLARLMVETGEDMGKKMVALITDMDQPLGRCIGNALEVAECVEVLRGGFAGSEDLVELTMELCGWMFLLGGRTASKDAGRALAFEMLRSGRAWEKFRELVAEQGGDVRSVDMHGVDVHNVDMHGVDGVGVRGKDDRSLAGPALPRAVHRQEILAPVAGFVSAIECERMGMAGVMLGGGRLTKEDAVDAAVGIVLHKKVGDAVSAGEPLCTVHYNSVERFAEAKPVISDSYCIGAHRPPPRSLIQKVIQGSRV